MTLKFKSEWPLLIEVARKNRLDTEQTILLLAFREVINGLPGYEFRRLEAKDKNLECQAILMAKDIKDKEFFYQIYLKRLNGPEYIQDFIEYMDEKEAYKLKRYIDFITQEFSHKEAT